MDKSGRSIVDQNGADNASIGISDAYKVNKPGSEIANTNKMVNLGKSKINANIVEDFGTADANRHNNSQIGKQQLTQTEQKI